MWPKHSRGLAHQRLEPTDCYLKRFSTRDKKKKNGVKSTQYIPKSFLVLYTMVH
jgi:hypothetical protein